MAKELESAERDGLSALTAAPRQPLAESWRSPAQAALLAEARDIEAREGADGYWAWAASKMRWSRPWDTLRQGGFGDLRYYCGGQINVADNCVDRHAQDPDRANRPAIIWEGEPGDSRTVTYAELLDEVSRLANGLKSLGVGRGDVVAIYLPNMIEAFAAVHACNRIGAIYTVLFSGFSSGAVALRLQAARAKVLVTADISHRRGKRIPLLNNARDARQSAPTIEHIIVVDRSGDGASLLEGETAYAALVAAQPATCPCTPLEANDPAFLIFTSGTEAKPKGVIHSVGGFLVGTWANVQWQIGLDGSDVYWCMSDIGWLTFPIQAVIGGLAHGATLVCYEGSLDYPDRQRVFDIALRYGVTKILTAPTALRMVRASTSGGPQNRLPLLKLVTVQGEALDASTFEWATRHLGPVTGVPVVNAYGQTETGSTWLYPVYGVDPLKPGSCGRPVPGHQCAILDDDGQPVGPGARGHLVLTHPFPTLARTIWDDPDRYHASYLRRFPGYYHCADEALVDADGEYWMLGRVDDVINVAGHRISTAEVEAAVSSCDGVVDAAVIGVSDVVKGTVPIAFVTLRSNRDSAEIRQEVFVSVERAIGGIARLDEVIVTAMLPKSRSGKILRRLLREAAEDGVIRGDTTSVEDLEAIEHVLAALAARRPGSTVG